MRIKQISVSKLFGIFDHIIPLNREERVTIIHGANGFGKTTLLRMINGLFNSRYSELANIDILMATHSPDIIHDRWDLTVELKGQTQ